MSEPIQFILQMINDEEIEESVRAIMESTPLDNYTESEKHAKIQGYFEHVIPKYNLHDFESMFRMSKSTAAALISRIGGYYLGKCRVPVAKRILLTIWHLAHQQTFSVTADRFGVAKASAYNIFTETVKIMKNEMFKVVTFPNDNEKARIAHTFCAKSNIGGIVGAIDGCHIQITAPPHNHHDYYNRKQVHSVVLQGMCDDKMRFTDVFIGAPGRMHDAKIFRSSPIFQKLPDPSFLPPKYHIMGDNAYPNSSFLITPFRDNGHLSPEKSRFNTSLSAIRQCIERAFGMLKTKFRKLKFVDIKEVTAVNEIIAACIFLHNFIIETQGYQDINTYDEPNNETDMEEVDQPELQTDKRIQFLDNFK